jgi:hypothetical protein
MAERNYCCIAQVDLREIPNGEWTSDDVRISLSYEDGPLGPEGFKVVYPDGYTYTVYFFTRAAWDAYRLAEDAPENPTDDWWDNAEGRIVDDPRACAKGLFDQKIQRYLNNDWVIDRKWTNPNEVANA